MKHDQIIAAQKLETQRKKQNENTALGILAGLLVLAIVTE